MDGCQRIEGADKQAETWLDPTVVYGGSGIGIEFGCCSRLG